MASNKLPGNLVGLKIGDTFVECEVSCEISFDVDLLSASPENAGRWKEYIPGVRSWSINLNAVMLLNMAGTALTKVLNAFLYGNTMSIKFSTKMPSDIDNFIILGKVHMKTGGLSASVNSTATWNVTLEGTGPMAVSYNGQPLPPDPGPGSEYIFTPMQKRIRKFNVVADFNIPSIFNGFSILEKIILKNAPVAGFTAKIGVSAGGKEVGEFDFDATNFSESLDYVFEGDSTLYFSGFTGIGCDIYIIYKQLDVVDIIINDPTPPVIPVLDIPKNTILVYEEMVEGQINVDFDMLIGLGRPGTRYDGFAVCDGRNGTVDWRGRSPLMFDTRDTDFTTLKTVGGEKKHKLLIPELPSFKPQAWVGNRAEDRSGGRQTLSSNAVGSNGVIDLPVTIGGDVAHNNMHPYITTMFIKKIV